MNWVKIEHGVPDKFGEDGNVEVLCKVRTYNEYCNHLVLRFDEDGWWWQYLPALGPTFRGGWVGIGDIEILEWTYITD